MSEINIFDFSDSKDPTENDAVPIVKKETISKKSEYTPFDFIASASQTKVDLVKTAEIPEQIEKQYNAYIVNRGFSIYEDTILHANEMNKYPNLYKDAQYKYYLGALRPRKRYTDWPKTNKDKTLDMIQKCYQCNRTIARHYASILTSENIKMINKIMDPGGSK